MREVKQTIVSIEKCKRTMSQESIRKRKADTRRKIQIGGLVIKAGLDYLHEQDKALLLGIFLDGMNQLEGAGKATYKQKCQLLGKDAFNADRNKKYHQV